MLGQDLASDGPTASKRLFAAVIIESTQLSANQPV
jgi:hypothetical protein